MLAHNFHDFPGGTNNSINLISQHYDQSIGMLRPGSHLEDIPVLVTRGDEGFVGDLHISIRVRAGRSRTCRSIFWTVVEMPICATLDDIKVWSLLHLDHELRCTFQVDHAMWTSRSRFSCSIQRNRWDEAREHECAVTDLVVPRSLVA